jgi:hypothetical protein
METRKKKPKVNENGKNGHGLMTNGYWRLKRDKNEVEGYRRALEQNIGLNTTTLYCFKGKGFSKRRSLMGQQLAAR